MCEFCEKEEKIVGNPDRLFNDNSILSLRFEQESQLLKVRLEKGSAGYTLPIQMNFCMFCGKKITNSMNL